MGIEIITGDCRQEMVQRGPFDMIVADPPYGDTSLAWDRRVHGWLQIAHARLKPTGSLWLFGSNVRDGIHKTQKPTPLLEILIRTSCPPGGVVGDFFAGSGSAGEACAMAGRNYIGCEIDPDMAAKARDRLGASLFSNCGGDYAARA